VRDRRRELGAFLRSRRARLRPAEAGLPDWGVRRVPGLRREEVAQLANVGLTWYTWLEQGRQARPSASVLTAIADALRLDAHEREHLFALARDPDDQARGPEDHLRAPASAGPERRLKRFRHPSAGPLTLHSTSLLMADDPMIRIVILYPATASDAAKLERLGLSD
jgi:transcriptional regulator with XRE-family HTH domain